MTKIKKIISSLILMTSLLFSFALLAEDDLRILLDSVASKQAGVADPSGASTKGISGKFMFEGKQVEVVKVGSQLGEGALGIAYKTVLKLPDGAYVNAVIKFSKTQEEVLPGETARPFELNEKVQEKMKHLFQNEQDNFHFEKIVEFTDNTGEKKNVVISALANQSLGAESSKLILKPKDKFLDAKLGVIEKFMDQGVLAIDSMKKAGVNHGDIKPENFLVQTDPGFDWKKPDASKISFQMADLDGATELSGGMKFASGNYFSPEGVHESLKTGKMPMATSAYDAYSMAVSLYKLALDDLSVSDKKDRFPYVEFAMTKPKMRNLTTNEMIVKLYSDPELYKEYMEFIKQKLDSSPLMEAKGEAKLKAERIRDFILRGLSYDPEVREKLIDNFHAEKIAATTKFNAERAAKGEPEPVASQKDGKCSRFFGLFGF